MRTFIALRALLAAALAALAATAASAQDNKLRLLTWADYVPADVVAQFKKETGIDVEVTLSNNEEMISKLRATGGAGFDLAQPSQDRIVGPQQEFGIYKPIDMSKIKTELFIPSMLDATKKNTTLERPGLRPAAHLGHRRPRRQHQARADVATTRTCASPEYKGKTSMRLKRPTLLAFAFASGKDPFALYNDPKAYAALMDDVGKKLAACKANIKFFWDNKDQLLNGDAHRRDRRRDDVGHRRLEAERRESGHPVHRAASPARWAGSTRSRCRPRAATTPRPTRGSTSTCARRSPRRSRRRPATSPASKGADQLMDAKLKAQFAKSFPEAALKNIKWYPAVPPGIEDIEGKVLDRVKAAS